MQSWFLKNNSPVGNYARINNKSQLIRAGQLYPLGELTEKDINYYRQLYRIGFSLFSVEVEQPEVEVKEEVELTPVKKEEDVVPTVKHTEEELLSMTNKVLITILEGLGCKPSTLPAQNKKSFVEKIIELEVERDANNTES